MKQWLKNSSTLPQYEQWLATSSSSPDSHSRGSAMSTTSSSSGVEWSFLGVVLALLVLHCFAMRIVFRHGDIFSNRVFLFLVHMLSNSRFSRLPLLLVTARETLRRDFAAIYSSSALFHGAALALSGIFHLFLSSRVLGFRVHHPFWDP